MCTYTCGAHITSRRNRRTVGAWSSITMDKLKQIQEWFQGKKTYIGEILVGLLGLLGSCGVIEPETAIALASIVYSLTGVARRAAISRMTDTVKNGKGS